MVGTAFQLWWVADHPPEADPHDGASAWGWPLFSTEHLPTAELAWAALDHERPDAIVLRLAPDEGRAVEAVRRLRSRTHDAALVAVAAARDADLHARLIAAGADHVLVPSELASPLFVSWLELVIHHSRSREVQTKLNNLLQMLPDAVLVVDDCSRVLFVNDAAVSLFARTRAELLAEPLSFSVRDGEAVEVMLGARLGELRVAPVTWDGKDSYLAVVRETSER